MFDNADRFQKGKFEKSAYWEKRRALISREIKLGGGRTLADPIYFLYDYGAGSITYDEAEYDADKETWAFAMDFQAITTGTCIPILSQRAGSITCLIVSDKWLAKPKAFVSMPPAVAAVNDKKLQIAVVGQVVEPYFRIIDTTPNPTSPSGTYFKIHKIVCLNPNTGQEWKVEIPKETISVERSSNDVRSQSQNSQQKEIEQLRKTVLLDPTLADSYLKLGQLYSSQGENDKAISAFNSALLWNKDLIAANIGLGKIYYARKDYTAAQIEVESALRVDAKHEDALILHRLIESAWKIESSAIPGIPDRIPAIEKPAAPGGGVSRSFEGKWHIMTSGAKESIYFVLSVTKKGSKYKGLLINDQDRNETSKTFDVKFDGKAFSFNVSWTEYYVIKNNIRFSGTYDGSKLNGVLTATSSTSPAGSSAFHGVPIN
ncbi:MAG TPA: hypothetical protein VNA17_11085 [Pyrinomonadaceae bacterium]|nr:hypothetical protein [Pyrinomonadaceae bacterium]